MAGREITIKIGAQSKVEPALDKIRAAFGEMGDDIEDTLDDVNEKAEESGKKAGLSFGGIATAIAGALNPIVGIASTVFSAVGSIFSGIGSVIGSAFSTAVSVVQGVFSLVIDAASAAVSSIVGAFQALPDLLGVIFNKVTVLGTAAFGFLITKLGGTAASAESLRNSLDSLASSAGTTGAAILEGIGKGSLGAIGGLEAVQLANNALLLDVAKTPEEFRKLSEAALVLGRSMGRDLNAAFGDIVIGIGRMSKPILDNLGIITNMEKAIRKYAGKQVNLELSERERKLVLLGKAQKKLADDTVLAGSATAEQTQTRQAANQALLDAALRTGDFNRILDKTTQAEAIAEAGTAKLQKAMSGLSDEEKKLAFLEATMEGAAEKIAQAGGVTDDLTTKFARMNRQIEGVWVTIAEVLGPALGSVAEGLAPLIAGFRDLVTSNKQLIQGGLQRFLERGKEGIIELGDRIQALILNTSELRESIADKLASAWDTMKAAGATALRGVFVAIAFVRDEFNLLRDAVRGFMAGDDFNTSGSGIYALLDLLGKNIELFATKAALVLQQRFADAFIAIEVEFIRISRLTDDAAGVLQNYAGQVQKVAGSVVSFFPDEDIQLFGADPNLGSRLIARGQERIDSAERRFIRGRDQSPAANSVARRLARESVLPGLEERRDESLANFLSIANATVSRGDRLQGETRATIEELAAAFDKLTTLPEGTVSATERALGAVTESAEKNVQATEAVITKLEEVEAAANDRDARIQALLERGVAGGNTIKWTKPPPSVPARN